MPVAQQHQSQESQTCTIETVDKAISVPEIESFTTEYSILLQHKTPTNSLVELTLNTTHEYDNNQSR
jgi:hypothetical protein